MTGAANTVEGLHAAVDREAKRLQVLHAGRLQCKRGCSGCCVDDLTVFAVEAAEIQRHHGLLLATGVPHAPGGCAFLDDAGGCRIYAERPYVCRTQGLPLRWIEDAGESLLPPVELRDICPLNETAQPLEHLPAEGCWTLGPIEERLAELQLAAPGPGGRIALRTLFGLSPPPDRAPAPGGQ